MKKIRIMLAAVLAVLLLTSVVFITAAEPDTAEPWQADLPKLMDSEDVPRTTEIRYRNTYDEGVNVDAHDIACEITVNGVTYGCEFTFDVTGDPVEDWSAVQDWLGSIVTGAASTDGGDSETLAKAIDKAIAAASKNAAPNADGNLPLWAQDRFAVSVIRVSTPFYPELKVGKNGDATKRLQQRLIEMGFLSGGADGIFGEGTKAAVEALENYVRELEQDLIDARPVETPVPTPSPTPVITAAPTVEPGEHELTLIPRQTAEPTPTPTPVPTEAPMDIAEDAPLLQPVTAVDGVADNLLQAYIYSDACINARRELTTDDSGNDVTRLQRRLLNLGCTLDQPDGTFGGSTARAVRIFQHYNALPETGRADMDTLNLLFSADAKAPDHAILAEGSTGEDVKTLQTRLRELGFTNIGTDGSYGSGTKLAVETLQQYMQQLEQQSGETTIEINGIADPMLLDAFYADSFPAIPAQMSSGTKGEDVVRVQRRLGGLEFYTGTLDGHFGGQTGEAITAFQKRNKLPQSGTADAQTLSVLFSGDAKKALKPYEIRVSTDKQRVYVYGLDDNSEYTVLVKEMKCSTGRNSTPTPKGTYQATTGPGARWHYFKKFDCWAQYAYYIEGDIMFHSVLYNQKDGPVTRSSVNNLGHKASHGCVRLSVDDAKWIYQNCPSRTKVIVY